MTDEEWDYTRALHDAQRIIAKERSKTYSRNPADIIQWSEQELEWILGAQYKIMRVRLHTRTKEKALDDVCDAANYLALLFDKVTRELHPVKMFKSCHCESCGCDYPPTEKLHSKHCTCEIDGCADPGCADCGEGVDWTGTDDA